MCLVLDLQSLQSASVYYTLHIVTPLTPFAAEKIHSPVPARPANGVQSDEAVLDYKAVQRRSTIADFGAE